MSQPKISVITICYNEPNLEKTCESIVNQTYQDFEWIVVDGGSNQETLAVFEKYKHQIDTFISEKDNGIYDACNKGIKLAKAEYVNLMNAGDVFSDKYVLQKVFENKSYKSDIIYSDAFLYYPDDSHQNSISYKPKEIKDETTFIEENLCTQAVFIRTSLFHKYGYFNLKYKIVADRERWICFAKHRAVFEYIDVPIAVYDMSGVSSNVKNQEISSQELNEIFKSYFSKKQLKQFHIMPAQKMTYTFAERLFSIKNNPSKTRKIITILGFQIKMKRKKK